VRGQIFGVGAGGARRDGEERDACGGANDETWDGCFHARSPWLGLAAVFVAQHSLAIE
jgi:hypothetical protein